MTLCSCFLISSVQKVIQGLPWANHCLRSRRAKHKEDSLCSQNAQSSGIQSYCVVSCHQTVSSALLPLQLLLGPSEKRYFAVYTPVLDSSLNMFVQWHCDFKILLLISLELIWREKSILCNSVPYPCLLLKLSLDCVLMYGKFTVIPGTRWALILSKWTWLS